MSPGGAPDGLCVDGEGARWIAMWGSYEVCRYAPNGKRIGRVALSVAQPSWCTIGGANATTLFITTAQEDMAAEQLEQEHDAGRLFCVDVGITGQATNPYRPSVLTSPMNGQLHQE